MSGQTYTLAHSPDSDDAFMFAPLANKLIDTRGLEFEEHLHDIQSLNEFAFESRYDVTALSLHAFFLVEKNYKMLNAGASVGDNYGPVLVSAEKGSLRKGSVVAIPGRYTTAALVLRLFEPDIETVNVPFDQITGRVASGEFKYGVLIHEGQLTYSASGLNKIVDLGQWYREITDMPLVLGIVAAKKELRQADLVNDIIRDSVRYSLSHVEEILPFASRYARNLSPGELRKFIGMYVNEHTLEFDSVLSKSAEALRSLALSRGFIASA